jgi:anti-anti-sigma factor
MNVLDVSPDGDRTLVVAGEIDMLSVPTLDAALRPFVDTGGTVTLDMRGVSFMDSSGVKVILGATKALEGRGTLVVRDPQPMVVRLLRITGLLPAPDGVPLEVHFDGHAPQAH